jgi:putative transposase
MSSRYKVHDDYKPHFLTSTVIQWIDALSRPDYKEVLVDSLLFAKGLQVHAWVIMRNHFHLVASAKEGSRLSDILRDVKKFTSRKIIKTINSNPQESRRFVRY